VISRIDETKPFPAESAIGPSDETKPFPAADSPAITPVSTPEGLIVAASTDDPLPTTPADEPMHPGLEAAAGPISSRPLPPIILQALKELARRQVEAAGSPSRPREPLVPHLHPRSGGEGIPEAGALASAP
jgi:hypothetical protein